MTPQSRPPPAPPPAPLNDSCGGSWQRAPGPVAQLFQAENAFDPLSGGRKLPSREVLDAGIFADLGFGVRVPFHPTLDIRRIFERRAEFLFLLLAVRTPVSAIHLEAAVAQAAGKGVVLVLAAVAEIV